MLRIQLSFLYNYLRPTLRQVLPALGFKPCLICGGLVVQLHQGLCWEHYVEFSRLMSTAAFQSLTIEQQQRYDEFYKALKPRLPSS